MSEIEEDNKTFGTLLIGVIVVLALLWLVQIVLKVFFSVAQWVLTLGLYAFVAYMILGLIFYAYAKVFPRKTPVFMRNLLSLHHYLAGLGRSLLNFCTALFKK